MSEALKLIKDAKLSILLEGGQEMHCTDGALYITKESILSGSGKSELNEIRYKDITGVFILDDGKSCTMRIAFGDSKEDIITKSEYANLLKGIRHFILPYIGGAT
jgi:hypothetical protein